MASNPFRLVRPSRVDHPASIEFMNRKLAESGLVPDDIEAYPVAPSPAGEAGFLIPYADPAMYRIRYDRKENKYQQPKGLVQVWFPPRHDPSMYAAYGEVYIIEGELKAAAFAKRFGHPTFGIGGCWVFRDKSGEKPRLLPELMQAIRKGSVVHVIFDGDIDTNTDVQMAAHALNALVNEQYGTCKVYKTPVGKGVDDWLVADPQASIEHLIPVEIRDLAEARKAKYDRLGIKMTEKGTLVLNELNASKIMKDYYGDRLINDRRIGLIYDQLPWTADKLELHTLSYFQDNVNFSYKPGPINTGIRIFLDDSQVDLLQGQTQSLEWDGVPRLDTWGSEYFDTNWPEYANEWGRILITGMTLRILQPGTKFDYACMLVGAQGIGKSTFFEELATFDDHRFYTALTAISESGGDTDRTQGIKLETAVIADLAEGIVFQVKKHNQDSLKQFISQTSDQYRQVYSKTVKEVQRGFIFVSTTNRRDQLSDGTGSRRFLTIEALKIKRLPYHIKLQLMAEVVEKEDKIRASEWYAIKVDIATAPAVLKTEENSHIKTAQALANSQYNSPDAVAELIEQILDGQRCSRFTATGQQFISANFVVSQSRQDGTFATKNFVSRKLTEMSSNPSARYKLDTKRIRLPQLELKDGHEPCYMEGVSNEQAMIVGFLVTKK